MDYETADDMMEELAAPKRRKRGRPAVLTREQVDDILLSDQPVDVLAVKYGVSVATINRARHHAYATADEDRAHSYIRGVETRGRKLADGRYFSEKTRAAIAADPSPAFEVAYAYNVSPVYVYSQRRKYGTSGMNGRRGPLPQEVIDEIQNSDHTDEALAHLFSLSVAVVKAVRGMKDDDA